MGLKIAAVRGSSNLGLDQRHSPDTDDQYVCLGVTIVDTISCAVNWVKMLYALGTRNFLFKNMRTRGERLE